MQMQYAGGLAPASSLNSVAGLYSTAHTSMMLLHTAAACSPSQLHLHVGAAQHAGAACVGTKQGQCMGAVGHELVTSAQPAADRGIVLVVAECLMVPAACQHGPVSSFTPSCDQHDPVTSEQSQHSDTRITMCPGGLRALNRHHRGRHAGLLHHPGGAPHDRSLRHHLHR